jgi:hypothetical protein
MNHRAMKHAAFATFLPLLLGACAMTPAAAGSASISGAIRVGNQAGPAMRVCAMPVGGGTSRCVDSAAGAGSYRIDGLAAGRYHVVGWVKGGELRMVAHATTIRCIRAPCPPDELIAVDVGNGVAVTGIDLQAPYTEVPAGWPQEP